MRKSQILVFVGFLILLGSVQLYANENEQKIEIQNRDVFQYSSLLCSNQIWFWRPNQLDTVRLELFGLKSKDDSSYYEVSIEDYIVDTMYHMIKIGDDVLLDKCETEQTLKRLNITLDSKKDEEIAISWRLVDNYELYYDFFVEKSIDGVTWKELEEDLEILQVSDLETIFTIKDNDPTSYVFYRLKHYDCHDNFVYSNIVRTDKWINESGGVFTSKFTVSIDNPTETPITYQIQDIKGNILKKKVLSDKKVVFADGSDLNDGVYFMFLINEDLHHIIDYKMVTKVSK